MQSTTATGRLANETPAHGVDALLARIGTEGSARHPHLVALGTATGPYAARDLADAVHLLCHLYGAHPGMVDQVLAGPAVRTGREWLTEASDAFERERLYLVRLTAAVGPLPSTPGSTETESALLSQSHALDTLARSERSGCAYGAAAALIAEWTAFRPMLDRAATRAGIECPMSSLPDSTSIADALDSVIDGVAAQRGAAFGAEQLLLQHRGLLDLLEARTAARVD